MTLVVCYQSGDELHCLADSRITRGQFTATDHGSKQFLIPVTARDGSGSVNFRYTFGFAFAGATLPATSTHALASTCTQLLYGPATSEPPSIKDVAELYAHIGTFFVREINSRKTKDFELFDAIIFGFCPSERRLCAFSLSSETVPNAFVSHSPISLEDGVFAAFGSGADAYLVKLHNGVHPSDAFNSVLEEGEVQSVGGYAQLMRVRGNGDLDVMPILRQSTTDPDKVTLTLLGYSLDKVKVGTFSIGHSAIGMGVEKTYGREALRRIGVDPTQGPVPKSLQNLASLAMAVEEAAKAKTPLRVQVDDTFHLAWCPTLPGHHYFMGKCKCGRMTPLFADRSKGKFEPSQFIGGGTFASNCTHCGAQIKVAAKNVRTEMWR